MILDKIKREFFQPVVTSVLLYSSNSRTKCLLKRPDEYYISVLRAVFNKSRKQRQYGYFSSYKKILLRVSETC